MLLLHFLCKTGDYHQIDEKCSNMNDLIKLLCEVVSPSVLEHPHVQAQCSQQSSVSTAECENRSTSTILIPLSNQSQPSNHLQVQTWITFDAAAMYEDESVIPRRSLNTHKYRLQEFEVALAEAIRVATRDYPTKLIFKKTLHGWVKHNSITGNEYIIDMRFFHPKKHAFINRRVHLLKPLASNFIVRPNQENFSDIVHFVVPIANVTNRFDEFVLMYEKLLHAPQGMIHLVLVVYGEEELQYVSQVVSNFSHKHSEAMISIISGVGNFSRARALDLGIQHLQADDLAFLCDVDMIVEREFLDKCRKNTVQGKRVYYPEVFKMYNTEYVYWNKQKPKHFELSRSTGHWGYYAYGMLCIYKSDYTAAGGLNTKIMGWGGEDVEFYERILKKNFEVFRAPDSDLIHRWHPKICSRPQDDAASHKYEMCMSSKAEALADRRELARYIFSMERQ